MNKIDLIIDALEKAKDGWQCFDEYEKALAAARELKALAQPEQTKCPRCGEENPAEIHTCSPQVAQPEQEPVDIHCPSCLHSFSIVPVAKREWVWLTREEVDAIRENIFKKYQMALSTSKDITSKNNYSAFNFYRAIEAKLKEKNG